MHLTVPLGTNYPVVVKPGALQEIEICEKKALIVTDSRVHDLYYSKLEARLLELGIQVFKAIISPGESFKTLETAQFLYRICAASNIDRSSAILGLGGGVVTDLAGFVAATWMRGVPFYACPTTVIGMADAAIGGKTGVNFEGVKNVVGAFSQPRGVFCDLDCLKSLETRDLSSGLAEIVKIACTLDGELFSKLESLPAISELDPRELEEPIARAIQAKVSVIVKDPLDYGLRHVLNFGHTLGHAFESLSAQTERPLRHGEAVALGMIPFTAPELRPRLRSLLAKLGLQTTPPNATLAELEQKVAHDKKRSGQAIEIIRVSRIGSFEQVKLPIAQVMTHTQMPRKLELPASKSVAQRAILISAFSCEKSEIYISGELASDILEALTAAKALGAEIVRTAQKITIFPKVHPCQTEFTLSGSATTLRLLCPLLLTRSDRWTIHLKGSLTRRPLEPLAAALVGHNVVFEHHGDTLTLQGPLAPSRFELDTSTTSQFLSGFLLALPLLSGSSQIHTTQTVSRGYVELTLEMLKKAGIEWRVSENFFEISKSSNSKQLNSEKALVVPPDASARAFFEVLGELLSKHGWPDCRNALQPLGDFIEPDSAVSSIISSDSAVLDISATPDLFPMLAIWGALQSHKITFTGTKRLRTKESDRVAGVFEILKALGVHCEFSQNEFYITPVSRFKSAKLDTLGDHRLVMAAALATPFAEGPLTFDHTGIEKSFPNFSTAFEAALSGAVPFYY